MIHHCQNDQLYAPDRTYRKKIGKVRYVTHVLHNYHVCNGVSWCEPGVKQIDSIAEIGLSYHLNKY